MKKYVGLSGLQMAVDNMKKYVNEKTQEIPQGVGISSIVTYFAKWGSGKTPPSDESGLWSTTAPTMTEYYRFMWTYEIITLTDGTITKTPKRLCGVYGLDGESSYDSAVDAGYTGTSDEFYNILSYMTTLFTTSTDNEGMVLRVVDGKPVWETIVNSEEVSY